MSLTMLALLCTLLAAAVWLLPVTRARTPHRGTTARAPGPAQLLTLDTLRCSRAPWGRRAPPGLATPPAPALLPGARKLLLRPTRRGVLAEPGAGAGAGRSRMMSGPRARLRHLTNQG